MTNKMTEEGILTNHQQGNVQDMTEKRKAENQSLADAKAPSELQVALTGKFVAETGFIGGPQTDKAKAEAHLADRRAVEADAGTEKLLLDAAVSERRIGEVDASAAKLKADANFVSGAQTNKANADAQLAEHRIGEADASAAKLKADANFVSGAQTNKANADAQLAEHRVGEVQANAARSNAEAKFVSGPQSDKTHAEAALTEVRRLEALVEIARIENDTKRIERDTARIEAERREREANAEFTRGPRSYREREDGRASRSIAVKNYASLLGTAAQVVAFCVVAYFFFEHLGLSKLFF